jgi:hypothetical protein
MLTGPRNRASADFIGFAHVCLTSDCWFLPNMEAIGGPKIGQIWRLRDGTAPCGCDPMTGMASAYSAMPLNKARIPVAVPGDKTIASCSEARAQSGHHARSRLGNEPAWNKGNR